MIDRALVESARHIADAAPIWTGRFVFDGDFSEQTLTQLVERVYGVPETLFVDELPNAYYVYDALYGGDDKPQAEAVRLIAPYLSVDGSPFYGYTVVSENTFKLTEPPRGDVVAHVALRPAVGARQLAEPVGREYRAGIIAGALYRVLRINGASWANAKMALFYGREERHARNAAINRYSRDFKQGVARAQPRRFAAF